MQGVQPLRSDCSILAVRLFNLGGQGVQFATEYSECSFASNLSGLNMSDTYGNAQKRMPATYDEFYNEVNRKDWDVCLCVAGTDKSDSRRVVVTYVKTLQQIIVNLPSAINGLSKNELSIKQWLQSALTVT